MQTKKQRLSFPQYPNLRTLTHLSIISVTILIAYCRILNSYFIGDDFLIIKYFANSPFWETISKLFTSRGINCIEFYRPVSRTFMAIEYSLFHVNPFGYHLVNLLIHIVNSIIVYFIANKLTNYLKNGYEYTYSRR